MDIWPRQTAEENRQSVLHWRLNSPEKYLFQNAKSRAFKFERDFNISVDDIIIPELCPYLKVPLIIGTPYAPSIDRIDNTLGYVKGNVETISRKANTMKHNATVEELLEFAYEILERH